MILLYFLRKSNLGIFFFFFFGQSIRKRVREPSGFKIQIKKGTRTEKHRPIAKLLLEREEPGHGAGRDLILSSYSLYLPGQVPSLDAL